MPRFELIATTSLLPFLKEFDSDKQCSRYPWLLKMGMKFFLQVQTVSELQNELETLQAGSQVWLADGLYPMSQPLATFTPSDLSHQTPLVK